MLPFIGTICAFILTNAISVSVIYLQSSIAFNAALRQRKIEFLSTSLKECYNPRHRI
jgi:hypothetical protein